MSFASENKEKFIEWLEKQKIKISVAAYIKKFEEVSLYAQAHGVCKNDFWTVSDLKKFNFIRSKLSKDRLFKCTKRDLFSFFEKFSKQYAIFITEDSASYVAGNSDTSDTQGPEASKDEGVSDEMPGDESVAAESPLEAESVSAFVGANISQPDVFESAMLINEYLCIKDGKTALESGEFELSTKFRYLAHNCGNTFVGGGRKKEEIGFLFSCVDDILANGESSACQYDVLRRTVAIYKDDEGTFYDILRDVDNRYNDKSDTYKLDDLLKDLIVKEFYGVFRLNSSIHMSKFRNLANEQVIDFTICSDEEIRNILKRIGIVDEDKLYVYDYVAVYECMAKIRKIFSDGYNVIYLEKFYDDNREWFTSRNIQSWALLKKILANGVEHICFGRGGGFAMLNNKVSEIDAITNELIDKWGINVVHSYSEIFEILPYIPEKKIKYVLSIKQEFVYSSPEVFAKADLIYVTEDEAKAIYDYVSNSCDQIGYAFIGGFPGLKDILDENYNVSDLAVYDAIYNRFLSDDFSRDKLGILNRRISNSETLACDRDLYSLLAEYCKGRDEITYSELDEYTKSLIKREYKQKTLFAAYDVMIRAGKDKFVSDNLVRFDVDEIDRVLDNQVPGDFISVMGIVSFFPFPDCGIYWNHYVLESYCYRFSKKFRLERINPNDKNVGIIVRRMCGLGYYDILAEALAASDVKLNPEEAGRFLVENGYMAKARFTRMDEVIRKAEKIRGEE